jgi:hypothetical protein
MQVSQYSNSSCFRLSKQREKNKRDVTRFIVREHYWRCVTGSWSMRGRGSFALNGNRRLHRIATGAMKAPETHGSRPIKVAF